MKITEQLLHEYMAEQGDVPSFLDLKKFGEGLNSETSDSDIERMRRRIKGAMGVSAAQAFDEYIKEIK